jgi:hypothetical protein
VLFHAVLRTARSKRYALAAIGTETPWSKRLARHSLTICVDSLPSGTPPKIRSDVPRQKP